MAAYIKELLLDIANNNVVHHDVQRLIESGHSVCTEYLPGWEDQCIARCDVAIALERLFATDQVDTSDILILRRFLAGESTAELSIEYTDVTVRLVRILALLEEETQYTDEKFLTSVVQRYPKFVKTKEAYRDKLLEAGRTF